MIDKDPTLIVRDILLNNWDTTNTAYGTDLSTTDPPRIHTGWYDFGRGGPQVTVTNPDSFVVGGGETGYSGGTGAGEPVQVRAGTLLVNGWSGTREELKGTASDGSDVNPKQMAFELGKEVWRITKNHASGTAELETVGPDNVRGLVEDEAPEVVFRREVTVKYTYIA